MDEISRINSDATAAYARARIRLVSALWTSLPAILVLLLYARLVWFVLWNVVDTPFMDEWIIWSDILQAIEDGSLSWDFLVSLYNGHRLAVVRLVLLALLPTRWTAYPQALFTLVVTAVFMGVLWHQYKNTAGKLGARVDPWAAVALAALAFSCADINRLWGMGHEWHVVVLASTVCLMLLSARPFRWWRLLAAGLSAIVASFSVAAGLLAWIIGLPVQWIATAGAPVRARALICWAAAGAVACMLYLRNLPELGSSSGPALTPARAMESARFVLMYVGLPIQVRYDLRLFLGVGIAGVVMSVASYALLCRYRRAVLIPLLPWLALAVFSVGTGAMIAAARDASHVALYYITTARLFWISSMGALCLMLAQRSDERAESGRGWRRWRVPLIALILLSLEGPQAQVMLQSWGPVRQALLQAGYDAPDVCAGNWDAVGPVTYPADYMRSRYEIFANHGTAFTRGLALGDLELTPGSGFGAIDRAVVEASPPDDGPPCVRLSGWAVDPRNGEPAREVLLVHGGNVLKRGAVNQATPHIASRFDRPSFSRSGWAIFVSQQRWPRDASALAVYAVGWDRKSAYRLDLAAGVELPYGDIDRYQEYPLGFVVDLTQSREDVPFQLRGFSGPEAGGRWTHASEAAISVMLGRPTPNALKLVASVDAFLVPQHPTQRVEILVNGQLVGGWEFNLGDPMRERELVIPNSAIAGTKRLAITFRLPDAATPTSLALSPDTRLLGMRMARFRVTEVR